MPFLRILAFHKNSAHNTCKILSVHGVPVHGVPAGVFHLTLQILFPEVSGESTHTLEEKMLQSYGSPS